MKNCFGYLSAGIIRIVVVMMFFLWTGCGCGSGSRVTPPCTSNPDVILFHQPFFPKSHEPVTFGLNRINTDAIESIDLHVTVQTFDPVSGDFQSPTASFDHSWSSPFTTVDFTKTDGFDGSLLVTYLFTIKPQGCTTTITHQVTFATDPYPLSLTHHPIPCYVTGDISASMNVLFCPDRDFLVWINTILSPAEPDKFTISVGDNITTAILNDPYIRSHQDFLNFYFTNDAGQISHDPLVPHTLPTDLDLTGAFIQAFMILHSDTANNGDNYRDATYLEKNISSSGFCEKGTLVHELGHSLYGLADEYQNRSGNWNNPFKPNNWPTDHAALSDAGFYSKTSADLIDFTTGFDYWKLCQQNSSRCQMRLSGMFPGEFDTPCQWAIYVTHYYKTHGTYPSH